MNRSRIMLLIVVLGTGGLLYLAADWIISNVEFYEEEVKSGMSARARRNQLLAAEYFLQRSGLPVESVHGRDRLYQLPGSTDTLIVMDFNIDLSRQRQDELETWLRQGGHLITSIPLFRELEETNFLQRGFAIGFVYDSAANNLERDARGLVEVPFNGLDMPLAAEINLNQRLEYDADFVEPDVALTDEQGVFLLQYHVGDGLLTVLSDLSFLSNDEIARHDHAFILWQLTVNADKTWLLYSNQTPSLWALLWKYNPYVLSSMALLGVLLFWSLWHRFGPILATADNQRRDIMEHLSAVARFHLKRDGARSLLEQNRHALRQRCDKKHPALRTMQHAELVEWLAQRSGLAPSAVETAIAEQPADDNRLLLITRLLQRITASI